jgi:hypothetical protein
MTELFLGFAVQKVSPRSTESGKSYRTFPEEAVAAADLETMTPNASPEAYK